MYVPMKVIFKIPELFKGHFVGGAGVIRRLVTILKFCYYFEPFVFILVVGNHHAYWIRY